MKRLICLCLCFIFLSTSIFCLKFNNKAYADPFTASQIGSLSYAMMQSWGIGFTAGHATSTGMNNFMTSQVEDYVNSHGGSIADVFVGQMAVDAVGKLVVGYDMYNSVVGFVDWLKDNYTLSAEDFSLTSGQYQGIYLPETSAVGEVLGSGISIVYSDGPSGKYQSYRGYTAYIDGTAVASEWSGTSTRFQGVGATLRYDGQIVVLDVPTIDANVGIKGVASKNIATRSYLNNSLSWNGTDYVEPAVLNPDKEWTGTIGGYSVPDTNLDQLLGNIDQAVADNNLVVDGEVIDIPIPPPSPEPIDPGTPLGDVPWEGLDTNLQNLYNQGLEEIGAIGDAQDAIIDAVADQTGVLEGAIADNAGVVSGAIDQAVSDVGTAIGQNTTVVSGAIDQAVSDIQASIGEQTEALDESLSATAEGVETIAEALEDETINWQKFDLRGLFPFCIPFDIYNMLEALDASPTAPHMQLPFVIESIGFSYTIDLDFSDFDTVAAVMRQMELIVYGIALAWATSKVIKW